MKTYTIKPTKKQLKIIREYWDKFRREQELFYDKLTHIEIEMSKKTGIEDLEFFQCDGDWCGVGNQSRTMELIQLE